LSSLKRQIAGHLSDNAAHFPTPPPALEDIVLGLPNDLTDLRLGFYPVPDQDKKITTVAVAGLKDGGVLAWKRVGDAGGFVVKFPRDDDEEGDEAGRMSG
jgi:hypothetical protein